ncbi:MAG: ABC transporter substrate-binding protein [Clostridia bacterium]
MNKRNLCLLLCLMLALLCAPAMAETTPALTLADMAGRELTLDAPATRVIALNPADCEILYAIGAQDLLVGRGEYCNYPEEVTALPSVSSGAELNLEQILALEPQVMIMSKMAQTVEQVEALEKAGVKVVISDAQNIEGVYTAIGMLGQLTGRTEDADSMIADMRMSFADIAAKMAKTDKTIYFEVSPLEWGLWTAGSGTFMDEIATLCGYTNIFADVPGWVEISQEQVLERNPDFIITTSVGSEQQPDPTQEIASRPGWDVLKAVQKGNVLQFDSDSFSRPGPRLLDAAQQLCVAFIEVGVEPAA